MKPTWEMIGDVGAYNYSKGEKAGYQSGLDDGIKSIGTIIGTALVGALCIVGIATLNSWLSGESEEAR
jgi:hypothetical protein